MSVGESINCTSSAVGFVRPLEMLLVCLWENVSFAHVLGGYTLSRNAACVSVEECIICTCFRRVIRLIEMLLVCLWENVSFAHVFRWALDA